MTHSKPLLAVLNGAKPAVPPLWLMRQAGRYLPEYRALRATKGGFLELCYDPEAACEVTLQPIRRFGFDGAILFSDILVIPHAMGQDLWFEEGEGPRLAPPLVDGLLDGLAQAPERLSPIYETIRRVAAALPAETSFLGFAGSPWTIATYMVAGQGSKDQSAARALAYRDSQAFQTLIDAIVALTIRFGRARDARDHDIGLFPIFMARAVIVRNGELDRFDAFEIGRVQAVLLARPRLGLLAEQRGEGIDDRIDHRNGGQSERAAPFFQLGAPLLTGEREEDKARVGRNIGHHPIEMAFGAHHWPEMADDIGLFKLG